jgi:hypothetical protein
VGDDKYTVENNEYVAGQSLLESYCREEKRTSFAGPLATLGAERGPPLRASGYRSTCGPPARRDPQL